MVALPARRVGRRTVIVAARKSAPAPAPQAPAEVPAAVEAVKSAAVTLYIAICLQEGVALVHAVHGQLEIDWPRVALLAVGAIVLVLTARAVHAAVRRELLVHAVDVPSYATQRRHDLGDLGRTSIYRAGSHFHSGGT